MKLTINTNYDIHTRVRYKYVDFLNILEGKEVVEVEKEGVIHTIDVQVAGGNIYVSYGMDNDDCISSELILEVLE